MALQTLSVWKGPVLSQEAEVIWFDSPHLNDPCFFWEVLQLVSGSKMPVVCLVGQQNFQKFMECKSAKQLGKPVCNWVLGDKSLSRPKFKTVLYWVE